MLCIGLMRNTRNLALQPCVGPADLPAPSMHHTPRHPHTGASPVSSHSLECTRSLNTSEILHACFLSPEMNAHTEPPLPQHTQHTHAQ